jgi:RNA recognition motif-containing protein
VRIAESQAERENKLFIGMLPKTIDEEDLHNMFAPYGELREVHIIRGAEGSSKGCAFVKFVDRDAAIVAIGDMNELIPAGSTRPLVVKFADSKKQLKLKEDGDGNGSIDGQQSQFQQQQVMYSYPQGQNGSYTQNGNMNNMSYGSHNNPQQQQQFVYMQQPHGNSNGGYSYDNGGQREDSRYPPQRFSGQQQQHLYSNTPSRDMPPAQRSAWPLSNPNRSDKPRQYDNNMPSMQSNKRDEDQFSILDNNGEFSSRSTSSNQRPPEGMHI